VLRISQRTEGTTVVLLVEGRLAGPWVDELRRVMEPLVEASSAIALELADVHYVDAAGEVLLREAIFGGAQIRRPSTFVAAVTNGTTAWTRLTRQVRSDAWDTDRDLVAAILAGNERAFVQLVERHHRAMIHVARCHVESEAVAEEVAQDVWAIVLGTLDGWEGRGTLRSWIFRIVANQARDRGKRESRTVPFSALEAAAEDGAVDADLFHPQDHADFAGGFCQAPADWQTDRLESREMLGRIQEAIDGLPPMQRTVITLRDVVGCGADETCAELQVSGANQRVLLHRARRKVRAALDAYLSVAA